jgi:hypothetical protein
MSGVALLEPPRSHIATPREHGAALHHHRRDVGDHDPRGHIALAQVVGGRWNERAYTVRELPEVLPTLAGQADVYLTANRFWGWRRISRLAQMGALYADLDFYKRPELSGMHPLGVLEDAMVTLEGARMPMPTVAIATGRGLVLYWIHTPVPRAALPRWNACQRELWRVLQPFGADAGARDAARVLRLVGTRNSKAGAIVEAITPSWDVWTFEDLAVEILPLDRGNLADIRIQRAARRPSKSYRTTPEGFTAGTLWEARLGDLQALRRIRWFGELPPGQRDLWMFVAGVGMSWLAHPQVLRRELFALSREVASWSDREAKARMQAIFKRAHMAARGTRVEWNGLDTDPRYRFRNETVIEWLEINPEEERQMALIISDDERRRRDRERKEQERRRAGMANRAERTAQRRAEAYRLHVQGLTQAAIAQRLGISQQAVSLLLKGEYK